ncbi:hypothetical protein [Acetobacteroides hydrogenigenes]|uniref:Lipoprotein n=1 Tax=Acetobacteroides hydrogenigenes TaxID=979970 RepID=A0A4R2EE39_9BACT|nr:hypothetical protein [Acetobacteroides hydrogenigenes]TCN66743.1 hypothetical protein CLV25_10882 [Acetobacteroides hydrogenigenes]
MKTLKAITLSLVLLVLITACSKDEEIKNPEFKLATPDVIDEIDYQVYSAAISQVYQNLTYIVVFQPTSSIKSITPSDTKYKDILIGEFPNIDQNIFSDFVAKNDKIYNLDLKFNVVPKPFKLFSSEESVYYFKTLSLDNGWKEFHNRYGQSNGIIDLSRIGFNSAKDQAILETGYYTASNAAEGAIVYLVKENNIWKVKKVVLTWVS